VTQKTVSTTCSSSSSSSSSGSSSVSYTCFDVTTCIFSISGAAIDAPLPVNTSAHQHTLTSGSQTTVSLSLSLFFLLWNALTKHHSHHCTSVHSFFSLTLFSTDRNNLQCFHSLSLSLSLSRLEEFDFLCPVARTLKSSSFLSSRCFLFCIDFWHFRSSRSHFNTLSTTLHLTLLLLFSLSLYLFCHKWRFAIKNMKLIALKLVNLLSSLVTLSLSLRLFNRHSLDSELRLISALISFVCRPKPISSFKHPNHTIFLNIKPFKLFRFVYILLPFSAPFISSPSLFPHSHLLTQFKWLPAILSNFYFRRITMLRPPTKPLN
jgi:hypothetical protein